MPTRPSPPRRPAPLYFAEVNYGSLGIEFPAVDRDHNSRAEIIRLIREKRTTVVRVLEVTEPCHDWPSGLVQDVTDELVAEAEQPREPRSLDESAEVLRGMLIDRDRDLKKHGVFGW